MAEAVVVVVAKTLGNLLIEEGRSLHGVKDQAHQLHEDLKRMRWFLQDADARQSEADRVRDWVSQTRDLAYEAENLLERYAFKVESRRGRGILKRCIHLLDGLCTRYRVGSDIKSLKVKISDLTTKFRDYGIREIMENGSAPGGSSSGQQQLRRVYSQIVEEDLVGLASQVEMLAAELIGGNHIAVSIWGMGGLGKTTLAKQVYHHPDVRCNFKLFCWVCVSQKWQMRDLLQGIITKFMPDNRELIEKWRDEELVRRLSEFQQNKKCLIVLDDIWSSEAWESIKVAFPIGKNGSKVLLTTRYRNIATCVDAGGFLYQPRLLNNDESWELLKKKLPIERFCQDSDEIQRMEELGKQMVEHCGGLPLGIHVLGGILSTKHNLTEWKKVHKNIKSYLAKGDNIGTDQGALQHILTLSYNNLPYQLKPCFLYLSKYKEDARIKTESLYQIWMAEGLISMEDQIGEEPMIDVAERYLEELAQRCMVFVEMAELPSTMKFESCHLHDLMRALCLVKAKEENFIQLTDCGEKNGGELLNFSSFTSTSPRLALAFVVPRKELVCRVDAHTEESWNKVKDVVSTLPGVESISANLEEKVITFAGKADLDPRKVVSRIRKKCCVEFLSVGLSKEYEEAASRMKDHIKYVLSRKELNGNLRSFTSSFDGRDTGVLAERMKSLIDDFSMLRVLSIEGLDLSYGQGKFAVIDRLRLSSAIGKLIHLRYLSLRNCRLLIVPSSIGDLEHLQTLDLRYNNCKRIPNAVRKLKRLKHLYLPYDSKVRLDGLQSLEILENLDDEYTDVKVISTLTNLVSLKATISSKLEDVEDFIDRVNNLIRLRFLSLSIDRCNFSSEKGSTVLKKLFSCTPLTHLQINWGSISKLPEYEPYLAQHLHFLRLMRVEMEEGPMRTLEKLPELICLHLVGRPYTGEDMICHANGFPRLKILFLSGMSNLKSCCIEKAAMPNLSQLIIHSCEELKMIPDGLRFLRCLKELRINYMPEEFKSRLRVKEDNREGEDFHKVRHVPSIIIGDD